ncbi:diaminopimelate epimerase [Companilactobacillus allii]|uniref:Diaminopimelate epimerase n=1 Tax=Companilactobacillus allii TaxID=1847728 RepID=A0A1P8Q3G1_9LACO|nr:diaminopimelate epimerase [Companilactobacillus allii]APX72404.1 diaminopimelate epimerase [Companilactobacillus allii]USQ69497.1 diaminopimelate epimerase [Companilactobacillus allii]
MSQLLKVHGSENQFFILDQTQLNKQLSDNELKQLAIKLCDSNNNILDGADGLLVINDSKFADCIGQMRVINADGSEAKMCGNGLRTVSRYLSEKFNQDSFKVETLETNLAVKKSENFFDKVPTYSVEISPISFAKDDLPFSYMNKIELIDEDIPEFIPGQKFTALAVPNPHLISFVDEVDEDDLGRIGHDLNGSNEYFPEGVNVSFCEILDTNKLFVQTYERGVGFTNACGTGMSATSLAFAMLNKNYFDQDEDITVFNPGGMVKTNIKLAKRKEDSQIHLIGNATFTHELTISENDLHVANVNDIDILDTGEETYYQEFVDSISKI